MIDRKLVRAAFVAFILSRVLFYALTIAGSQISFLRKAYSNSIWETRIELRAERVRPELERVAMVGDAWWYRGIALHGYDRQSASVSPTPNWAFFPLFPLLVRTLAITGNFALDGMIVANAAFLCALILLGAVALRFGLDPETATRAIFYLAFFPTSYFLSLPLTESLFLALSLASILAAKTERWLVAGVLGGLAALTRFPGILLLVPLVLLYLASPKRLARHALCLALVPAGTGAFMVYLRERTGDPLAFVHAQANWQRSATFFWEPLIAYSQHPRNISEPWNFVALHFAVAMLLFVAAAILCVRRQWPLAGYTAASVLLPLSTGSLQSLGRYALVVFPLFLWLGTEGRRTTVDRLISAVSVTLYGWLIALMALRVDIALA